MKQIPVKMIGKVINRLSDVFWNYSIATTLMLTASTQVVFTDTDENFYEGVVNLALNDDFEAKRKKILSSKMLQAFARKHRSLLFISNCPEWDSVDAFPRK